MIVACKYFTNVVDAYWWKNFIINAGADGCPKNRFTMIKGAPREIKESWGRKATI
jgi:hypothetical protein